MAESCDYSTLKDELIRDRIVIGVSDSRTSERLQLVSDLTVDKALEMARQAETLLKARRFAKRFRDKEKLIEYSRRRKVINCGKRAETRIRNAKLVSLIRNSYVPDVDYVSTKIARHARL